MALLEIRNLSEYGVSIVTATAGGQGRPLVVKLRPNENIRMYPEDLQKWPIGSKQDLAEMVARATVQVSELNCVHIDYDREHLVDWHATDLNSALANAIEFKNAYNAHIVDTSLHQNADLINPITSADPITLPTLIALITEAQTDYNLHLGQMGPQVHVFNDLLNSFVIVAPVDLPTCLIKLEQLITRYHNHQRQCMDNPAVGPLSPSQIITY